MAWAHVTFRDGSNPYIIKNGNEKEVLKFLSRRLSEVEQIAFKDEQGNLIEININVKERRKEANEPLF